MLTIHVWPKWLKSFLLTHPLYKSPSFGHAVSVSCAFAHIPDMKFSLRPKSVYERMRAYQT